MGLLDSQITSFDAVIDLNSSSVYFKVVVNIGQKIKMKKKVLQFLRCTLERKFSNFDFVLFFVHTFKNFIIKWFYFFVKILFGLHMSKSVSTLPGK